MIASTFSKDIRKSVDAISTDTSHEISVEADSNFPSTTFFDQFSNSPIPNISEKSENFDLEKIGLEALSRLYTNNGYSLVDAEQALRYSDFNMFEQILANLPEREMQRKSGVERLRDSIDSVVRSLMERSKSLGGGLGLVDNAARVSIAALKNNIIPRNNKTVETLIVSLHKSREMERPLELALNAVYKGIKLKQETILTTISLAAKSSTSLKDLRNYCRFSCAALKSGQLDPTSRKVGRIYDVAAALLGDPQVAKANFHGSKLSEAGIMDVAVRLELANNIGAAIVDTNLSFDHERVEDRMNMLVRGVVTGSAMLTAQLEKLRTPGDKNYHRKVDRHFGIDFEYPSTNMLSVDLQREIQRRAGSLAISAMSLASDLMEYTGNPDNPVRQKYILRGSTVTTLMKAIHGSAVDLDSGQCVMMLQLLDKSLALESVRDKVHSEAFTYAIRSLFQSSSLEAPYTALFIAGLSMRSGFRVSREVGEGVLVFSQDIEAVQNADDLQEVDRIRQDIREWLSKKPRSFRTPQTQKAGERSNLLGGLGEGTQGEKYIAFKTFLAKLANEL